MTIYTCIACNEPVPPTNAVIVGLDISDFPARLPLNVVAHKECEDRGRAAVAKTLAAQSSPADGRSNTV